MNTHYDVIVIGGGPAGMMAAGCAGQSGARVCLIEKNDRLGKKLSITGGRRCNITNAEPDNHLFLENFPAAKQFLFSPFSQFNVESTFDFFESRGLPLVVEERKRAFPKSQKAEDVCKTLVQFVEESGNVEVKLNTSVQSILEEQGALVGVETSQGRILGKNLILATGGLAAPETGSTGEGLTMLEKIGHTIEEPDPNLAPLKTSAKWVHKLAGVSVNDMTLRYQQQGKTKHKDRGRILFTHFGISGPLVINSAYQAKELLKQGPLTATIDLFPDEDLGSLDQRLITLFEQHKNKRVKTVLKELLQKKLAETILAFPTLGFGDVHVHSVSKEQRKALVRTMKDLSFPITGTMGFEWAIVADGGVIPQEVQFKTMQSKLHPNLYLIGDTLHINRPSGGFSLQLCWTTGWIAGHHAADSTRI
jgi:predicted Rossmann fold flavoprotein